MNNNYQFNLINQSPWPLMMSISMMNIFMGLMILFIQNIMYLMIINTISIIMLMLQWWRDVIRESTYQGSHTFKIFMNMKWSMMLFIISELFFFINFFWSFFYLSTINSIEMSLFWPPKFINNYINPFQIPLLNTIILLSSGISITWTHQTMLNNNYLQSMQSMKLTIILGMYFLLLQIFEYKKMNFCMSDSSYGSIFYLMTGFHGSHVLIGIMFLTVFYTRHKLNHFSKTHHFNFEASSWYWHFVDIIWLFLFLLIYWWKN